jgi:hypothetical protein
VAWFWLDVGRRRQFVSKDSAADLSQVDVHFLRKRRNRARVRSGRLIRRLCFKLRNRRLELRTTSSPTMSESPSNRWYPTSRVAFLGQMTVVSSTASSRCCDPEHLGGICCSGSWSRSRLSGPGRPCSAAATPGYCACLVRIFSPMTIVPSTSATTGDIWRFRHFASPALLSRVPAKPDHPA